MNMYDGMKYFDGNDVKPKKVTIPTGGIKLDEPKPRTHQYHYTNPGSQGALICETKNFPRFYMKDSEEYHSAYSDRIASWDYDRFKKACEIGGGDQNWAYKLPTLFDETLKQFAQIIFDLPTLPKHVQVVHYYNVSSGYSCPVVIAISERIK